MPLPTQQARWLSLQSKSISHSIPGGSFQLISGTNSCANSGHIAHFESFSVATFSPVELVCRQQSNEIPMPFFPCCITICSTKCFCNLKQKWIYCSDFCCPENVRQNYWKYRWSIDNIILLYYLVWKFWPALDEHHTQTESFEPSTFHFVHTTVRTQKTFMGSVGVVRIQRKSKRPRKRNR